MKMFIMICILCAMLCPDLGFATSLNNVTSTTNMANNSNIFSWVGTNAAMITAFSSIVAIIIAFICVKLQINNQREISSAKMVIELRDRFESEEMIKCRQNLCKRLLEGMEIRINDKVLDFFETLSLLTKKGALEKEMVWSKFCYEIVPYWHSIQDYGDHINRFRKEERDNTFFCRIRMVE